MAPSVVTVDFDNLDTAVLTNDLPDDAWKLARDKFLQTQGLSDEEKKLLLNGSADSLRSDLLALEAKHAARSRFRRVSAKIHLKSLIDGLVNLEQAIGNILSADPHGIGTLVWGATRIVFSAITGSLRYMDDLFDFLNRIGSSLTRLQLYEKLVPGNGRLKRILFEIFIRHLGLCFYVRDSFIHDGVPRLSSKITWSFTIESFSSSMTKKIAEIDKLCGEAYLEAQLAVINMQLKDTANIQTTLENFSLEEKARHSDKDKQKSIEKLKEAKRRFLKWLRQVPTEEDFNKSKSSQLENTCQWIDDDEYVSPWLRSDAQNSSFLWISGAPGTGKTILASHIINQLQNCHPTAYFFCKIDDERKRSSTAVLQNWIWQLVHKIPVLPDEITQPSELRQSPTVSILRSILEKLQGFLKPCWLIVDGLDECEDELVGFLSCCQALSKEWRILIVSRDMPILRSYLKNFKMGHKAMTTKDTITDIKEYMMSKVMSSYDTESDMRSFIAKQGDELIKLKGWSPVLVQYIRDLVSSNAEGMFLWVRLVFDSLLEEYTFAGDLDDLLEKTPPGLDEFYERIIQKVSNDRRPLRKRIAQKSLQWIVHVFRPLTIEELHAAFSVGLKSVESIKTFESALRETCGLLIKIDDRTHEINVIHATVREYLLRSDDTLGGNSEIRHAQLSKTCLTYLCNERYSGGVPVDNNVEKSISLFEDHLTSKSNSFLDYSVVYWYQHLERSMNCSKDWEDDLQKLITSESLLIHWLQMFRYLHICGHFGTADVIKLIHDALEVIEGTEKTNFQTISQKSLLKHLALADGKRFLRWDRFLDDVKHPSKHLPKCVPMVLVAAHFNFASIVRNEIEVQKWPIEKCYAKSGSVLLWASRMDSVETVRYLLNKGANVNDQSHESRKPAIINAIIEAENPEDLTPGFYPVVQMLIEAGASLDVRDESGLNPLYAVVNTKIDSDNEVQLAKLILEVKPMLWTVIHPNLGTILEHSIRNNMPRFFQAIVEKIKSVAPDRIAAMLEYRMHGNTLLHFTLRTQPHLVPLVLQHGGLVDSLDKEHLLPIEFAARNDLGSAIRALVDRGVDFRKGYKKKPILQLALESGSMDAVKNLLDMGADLNEVPETILCLPKNTLDPRIREAKLELQWPLLPRDIFQVGFHLKRFLPIPLIGRIFDMAELWVQSSALRNDEHIIDQYTQDFIYLRSPIIVGRSDSPVQRVDIEITSHDQGWVDSREGGSWSWFETRYLCGPDWKMNRDLRTDRRLMTNVLADYAWHTQIATLSSVDDANIQDSRRSWAILKPGDRIAVIPRAQFSGWRNFVAKIRIDVYTSLFRQQYTDKEVYQIWGQETPWGTEYTDYIRFANRKEPILPRLRIPTLRILAAEYGGMEITRPLLTFINSADQSLTLNTHDLNIYFGDPWYGVRKALSMIYQYEKGKIQIFITIESDDGIEGIDGTTARLPLCPPRILASDLTIFAIIYGYTEVLAEDVLDRMYNAIINRQDYPVSNETLGGDTWFGNKKVCVVYYRRSYKGRVICSCARESTSLHFNV